jgi:NAD-dependent DNA ligase
VTGEFDSVSRDKIEQIIKQHGGTFVSGVSRAINYLLVGRILMDGRPPETSKKYQEAEKLGKRILREIEFEEMMREKTGNPEFTLNGKPRPKPQI